MQLPECPCCSSKKVILGMETYARRYDYLQCAPVVYCYACGEFIEPYYLGDTRDLYRNLILVGLYYPIEYTSTFRGRYLSCSSMRPFENASSWS